MHLSLEYSTAPTENNIALYFLSPQKIYEIAVYKDRKKLNHFTRITNVVPTQKMTLVQPESVIHKSHSARYYKMEYRVVR